eukprot:SAG31_NODE_144_length_22617_cov_21.520117_13_plen_49_part_00
MKFMSVKAVVTKLLKVMERYPESLERMYLVNVAWYEDVSLPLIAAHRA